MDVRTGEIYTLQAKAVMFGTGGYGRAFKVTTNAHASTGDGVALAYKAGVPLMDMEFVQFHPTGLYRLGMLMTEACRSEGGYLINSQGERFMESYAPEKMELAPRDLVTRAEQIEINEGRGIGPDGQGIFLDMTHLGREKIQERLPQVQKIALNYAGVDIIEEPVAIQPTAHYSMGGIPTDVHGQVLADAAGTPVVGFFAAGECACVSVHGANRLGTNSLLEASVFGRRAGRSMAEFVKNGAELNPVNGDPSEQSSRRIARLMDDGTGDRRESVAKIAQELKETMTRNCGIFRDAGGLEIALQDVRQLQERFKDVRVMDRSRRFNTEVQDALEAENLLTFSEVIVASALERAESRGAHARTDFPARDDENWLKHTIMRKGSDGTPEVSFKDVIIDWEKYPPQERVY